MKILDCVSKNKEYPELFHIPDHSSIDLGDNVKLIFVHESDCIYSSYGWVKITKIEDDIIYGDVLNDIHHTEFKCGMKIVFGIHCVMDLIKGEYNG